MNKLINIMAAVGLIYTVGLSCNLVQAAVHDSITITSIAQRAGSVFFGITYANGQTSILSAPQAQAELEKICPKVRFSPGVMQ